jgi:hypothetical protein
VAPWDVVKRPLFNSRQASPLALRHDWAMGDKSLKAKQRDQKQKDAAKLGTMAVAKAKQESHMRVQQPARKAAGKA